MIPPPPPPPPCSCALPGPGWCVRHDREIAGMTDGDRAQLRRELSERDSLYLAAYRLGYVGIELHPLLAREWDVYAAWQSGRDWARRDRFKVPRVSLIKRLTNRL